MKVVLTSLLILSLSALIFTPILPEEYPSEVQEEKNRAITLQERKLDNLLKKVEHQRKADSIEIQSIKESIN